MSSSLMVESGFSKEKEEAASNKFWILVESWIVSIFRIFIAESIFVWDIPKVRFK